MTEEAANFFSLQSLIPKASFELKLKVNGPAACLTQVPMSVIHVCGYIGYIGYTVPMLLCLRSS